MRKRLSLCLAPVLLLALISTVFAGTVTSRLIITATTYLPDIVIDVTVPGAEELYINPNKIPVQIETEVKDNQIISEPCVIENQSIVPVRVNVEVTGSVKRGSGLSLVSESTADYDGDEKLAFIYFEMHAVNSADSSVPWDAVFDKERHLVVESSTNSMKGIAILGANGEEKNFGAFRLTGDCVEKPWNDWTSRDNVTVKIVFTFSPLPLGTEIP